MLFGGALLLRNVQLQGPHPVEVPQDLDALAKSDESRERER